MPTAATRPEPGLLPGGVPDAVAGLLDRAVRRFGAGHPILEDGAGAVTAGALADRVAAASAALRRLGVRPGERVAASLPNSRAIVELFLAVQSVGAVWVGVHPALAADEEAYLLGDCGPALHVTAGARTGDAPVLEVGEWERLVAAQRGGTAGPGLVAGAAPGVIAYTSGTTGRPKGVVHSQHNLVVPAASFAWSGRFGPGDRIGVAYPLTTVTMMVQSVLAALAAGATCCILSRRDAAGLLEQIAHHRVQYLSMVPTTAYDVVHRHAAQAARVTTVRRVLIGAGHVDGGVGRELAGLLGAEVEHGYGLTEAPGLVTSGPLTEPVTAGRALPHVSVEVHGEAGEAGEIVVGPAARGPWAGVWTPPLGRWGRPLRAGQGDGRLRTGDLGILDERGELTVLDRGTELIVRGGANVYPAEVERVLGEHRAVRSAVVVARPDPRWGQVPVALVEGREQDGTDAAGLAEWCRRRLAAYKVPEVVVVREIRRTGLGKPDRAWAAAVAGRTPPGEERR